MLRGFFGNVIVGAAAPKQAPPSQASGSARTLPLLMGALLSAAAPAACFADQLQQIVDTYAGSMVQNGSAIGVGVAVVSGNAPPRFFTYGYANSSTRQPFSPITIFQIGSVTKVFTTNLLGQKVASRYLGLQQPLSNFSTQVGALQPLTSQATLEEVGDFTAGFVDTPNICKQGQSPPSCLPNGRPTIAQYTAQDFLAYIQASVPENYFNYAGAPSNQQPVAVSTLPAPYNYSDFSTGLLGLLLGSLPNLQIDNNAPDRWFKMVANNIAGPLGMQSTYLEVPPSAAGRASAGYDRALATATVSNGEVSSISVFNPGGPYTTAPNVQIVGGGGSGATATAVLDSSTGTVEAITVSNGGSGYVAPPTVTFSSGTAVAQAVVSAGKIVGISRIDGGRGYNGAPTVTISGGGGSGATAEAHNANGHVEFVSVESGGSGYAQPIAVLIDPPPSVQNAIPIWAPAGAISSTLTDMANFAEAALGRYNVGAGIVPPLLSAGFKIAQTPHACNEATPALPCSEGFEGSALAWAIDPADSANRTPEVISKNGGIPGFSTQINLMQQENLAVVVFANNYGNPPKDATSAEAEQIQAPAQIIANNILFALFFGH
jgi:CubicO group peptidase (beta-lactamase class C family)